MACKESICRNCFHSYVCEQFNENKDDNNEKCHFFNDHYVPTADVVEVVRCKDCKYWQDNNGGYPHEECRWGKDETPDDDDYCSYGERNDMNEHDATEVAFKNGYEKGVRDVFAEIESLMLDGAIGGKYPAKVINPDKYAELKKKYGEIYNG